MTYSQGQLFIQTSIYNGVDLPREVLVNADTIGYFYLNHGADGDGTGISYGNDIVDLQCTAVFAEFKEFFLNLDAYVIGIFNNEQTLLMGFTAIPSEGLPLAVVIERIMTIDDQPGDTAVIFHTEDGTGVSSATPLPPVGRALLRAGCRIAGPIGITPAGGWTIFNRS